MGSEKTDIFPEDSEDRYRQLFETMAEGVFWHRADGILVDVNPAALEIFGLTYDEFVKRTARDPRWNVVNENGQELRSVEYPSVIALRTGQAVRERILGIYNPRQGRYVWVTINAIPQFKDGKHEPYQVFVTIHDISEIKRLEEEVQEKEENLRFKLSSVLSPDYDIGDMKLEEIIDIEDLQTLMDDFYTLTKIGIGIIDLKGKVLVGAGWQDVCTCFYRVHPETHENCIRSDTILTKNLKEGEIRSYKCMNEMWDIATPIFIGGKHVGNIFLGQFFYEDETPDYDLFSRQAEKYGFNRSDFFEALSKVPRWSRKQVAATMHFYIHLAKLFSDLSYSNLKLARELVERKKLEKDLRESKELYQTLVNESPMGILTIRDNEILFANPKSFKAFGVSSPEEIIGVDPLDLFEPEDHDLISERLENVSKGERNDPITIQVKRKDGSKIDVEYVSVPVVMDGKPTILVEGKDVTARVNAEQALKESEEFHKHLIEESPVGILAIQDWKILFANPEFCRILGYSPDEFIGMHALDLIMPEDRELIQKRMKNIMKGRKNGLINMHFRKKDGSAVYTESVSVPTIMNGKRTAVVVIKDISDSVTAEHDLKESEQRFLSFVENTSDFVMLYDSECRHTYVNPAVLKATGSKEQDILGKTHREAGADPEQCDFWEEKIRYVFDTGEIFQAQFEWESLNGPLFLDWKLIPEFDEKGNVKSVLGISRDITEFRQAEKELCDRRVEAEGAKCENPKSSQR